MQSKMAGWSCWYRIGSHIFYMCMFVSPGEEGIKKCLSQIQSFWAPPEGYMTVECDDEFFLCPTWTYINYVHHESGASKQWLGGRFHILCLINEFNVHSEMWWKNDPKFDFRIFFSDGLGLKNHHPKFMGRKQPFRCQIANPGCMASFVPLFEVQKSGSLSSKSFEDPGNNLQPLRLKPKDAEYLQVTGLEGPGFSRYWSRVKVSGVNEAGKEIDGEINMCLWSVWKHFFLSLFPKSIRLGILLESCWLLLIAEVDWCLPFLLFPLSNF